MGVVRIQVRDPHTHIYSDTTVRVRIQCTVVAHGRSAFKRCAGIQVEVISIVLWHSEIRCWQGVSTVVASSIKGWGTTQSLGEWMRATQAESWSPERLGNLSDTAWPRTIRELKGHCYSNLENSTGEEVSPCLPDSSFFVERGKEKQCCIYPKNTPEFAKRERVSWCCNLCSTKVWRIF